MSEFKDIQRYQDALDELEGNAVQWMANHRYNEHHGYYVDNEGVEEMLNHSRILQTLLDDNAEREARRFKLTVGSKWECVADCMLWLRKTDEAFEMQKGHVVAIDAVFTHSLIFEEDFSCPIEQFLVCFRPQAVVEAQFFVLLVCRLHEEEIKDGFTAEYTENFFNLDSAILKARKFADNETNYEFTDKHIVFVYKLFQETGQDPKAVPVWANNDNLEEVIKFFQKNKEE